MSRSVPVTAAAPCGEAEVCELEISPAALVLQDVPQVCRRLEEGRQKGSQVGRTVEEDLVRGGEVVRRGSQRSKRKKGQVNGCVGLGGWRDIQFRAQSDVCWSSGPGMRQVLWGSS